MFSCSVSIPVLQQMMTHCRSVPSPIAGAADQSYRSHNAIGRLECACASSDYMPRAGLATRLFCGRYPAGTHVRTYTHCLVCVYLSSSLPKAKMATNATAKICRRLFQDAAVTAVAPRAVVQQTMEQVIRADQERFSALWNFDVSRGFAQEAWQVITKPKAAFYIATPRKSLKARRRLNISIADRLRLGMQSPKPTILTEKTLLGNYTFKFNEPGPSTSQLETTDDVNVAGLKPQENKLQQSIKDFGEIADQCISASHVLSCQSVLTLPAPKSKAPKRKSIRRLTGRLIQLIFMLGRYSS